MELPVPAIRCIQFIILGVWSVNAAARTNPYLVSSLLREYQAKYRNGSTTA